MSAVVNGGEAVKPTTAAANAAAASGSKHQSKSSNNGTKLDAARKQAPSPVDAQNKKAQANRPSPWSSGINPVTGRPSSTVANGNAIKPASPQPPSLKSDTTSDKRPHDRCVFLFSQLVGKDVTITLKNGEQFTGLFSGGAFDTPKQQYIVKMARRIKLPSHQQVNGDTEPPFEYIGEGEDHSMSFEVQDTVELSATDVTTTATLSSQQNGSSAASFLTDTQISGRELHMPRERELQRWQPGPDDSIGTALEDSGDASWDQFAANEKMYGVQSNYDESFYTTQIDRSNPEYRRREADAERIAREIEGSAPANAHIAEERRRDADRNDLGGDEEEKYSGVRREGSSLPRRSAGGYIPPAQRAISGAPSAPGVPFDPAIISTEIKAPPALVAIPTTTNAAEPEDAPAQASDTSAAAASLTSEGAEVPKKKENTTEDRVRDTADAFKQFANNEKLRIRQAQEAKRVNMRQEKNVKLNDLKKFAANFKLKSRVPDDLVPILAKDREKQLEIQQKAELAAKEEEVRSKDKESDQDSSTAPPAPSSSVSQVAPAAAIDPRMSFNQNSRRPVPQPQTTRLVGGPSPRQPLAQRIQNNNNQFYNRQGMPQPLPAELRIPTGANAAAGPPPDMPMSPNSATRLNVNAKSFEFRPGASEFNPTGTSPSPQRSTLGAPLTHKTASFFSKKKKADAKPAPAEFDPLRRMAEADYPEDKKQRYTKNGGVPYAFDTLPTWSIGEGNDNTTHVATFPKAAPPSQGPSPMHTPNPAHMPHAHQLPVHMQTPSMPPPNQRGHFYGQHQHGHGPSFDPRMQHQFGSNGSVQNSPRAQPMPVAPFNGQMPQVQQYPGQPPMQGYGISPSMQYRTMAQQGGPMMMPNHSQPGPMMPMRPNYGGGPQFGGPPQMGGHIMVQNPSGGYANGPVPQSGFSPMPPHVQPHMPHIQQHSGPGAYSGSPRPPMMSHQGSHQGYQPGMMQTHFAPPPAGPQHPYHLQQRAMSGGYAQMTPRSQHAVPNHSSPGMAMATQGDEGK